MLSGQKARYWSWAGLGLGDALRVVVEIESGLGEHVGDRGASKRYSSKQISKLTPFPKLIHSGMVPVPLLCWDFLQFPSSWISRLWQSFCIQFLAVASIMSVFPAFETLYFGHVPFSISITFYEIGYDWVWAFLISEGRTGHETAACFRSEHSCLFSLGMRTALHIQ